MRADDIRGIVLTANERALASADRLIGMGVDPAEVDRYRAATQGHLEFWRDASPAFVHAWFAITQEEAGRGA